MEFVPANYSEFKHGMQIEEGKGYVPSKWSTTSQMSDPSPPKEFRVKSGYTGHVPYGRTYIGGRTTAMDNPGTATKMNVPVMHINPQTGQYPINTKPVAMSSFLYHDPFHGEHDPFNSKPCLDKQHEYGMKTSAPVPARVEKVLSGDTSDISDADNRKNAFRTDGAGQWVMAGYTGHVPKGREVYGTSYYGPPEGPSYHGPFYESDVYGQPGSPNKESIAP